MTFFLRKFLVESEFGVPISHYCYRCRFLFPRVLFVLPLPLLLPQNIAGI